MKISMKYQFSIRQLDFKTQTQRAVGGLEAHTPSISSLTKRAIGSSKTTMRPIIFILQKCLIQFVPNFHCDNTRY